VGKGGAFDQSISCTADTDADSPDLGGHGGNVGKGGADIGGRGGSEGNGGIDLGGPGGSEGKGGAFDQSTACTVVTSSHTVSREDSNAKIMNMMTLMNASTAIVNMNRRRLTTTKPNRVGSSSSNSLSLPTGNSPKRCSLMRSPLPNSFSKFPLSPSFGNADSHTGAPLVDFDGVRHKNFLARPYACGGS